MQSVKFQEVCFIDNKLNLTLTQKAKELQIRTVIMRGKATRKVWNFVNSHDPISRLTL